MMKNWLNNQTDLFAVTQMGTRYYIDQVRQFVISWLGDPKEEIGCTAMAVIEADFVAGGQILASLENGDSLVLVSNKCGQHGSDNWTSDNVLVRLDRIAIEFKSTKQLVAGYPDGVALPTIRAVISGQLRLW